MNLLSKTEFYAVRVLLFSSPGRSPGRAIVLSPASALAKSLTLKFFMQWARHCQESYPVPVIGLVFYGPVTIVRGIKICPCLSVGVTVRLSMCSSHFRVKSLCNQLLPQFSVDLFETLHTCYGHIEDVHVDF